MGDLERATASPQPAGGATPPSPQAVSAKGAHQAHGRPSSVMLARDPEVLRTMLAFYAPGARRIVDCTANERKMWRGLDTSRVTFCDINAAMNPDIVADFTALPFGNGEIDLLVFDPPHLPEAAASAQSDQEFAGRYGLSLGGKGSDISHFFGPFLAEANRVLKSDGLVFAKLKDFVHNHAYRWTLADFITAVRAQDGLTACDLIVKRDPSAGNMMSGRWKRAHHARNAHCWWIIVRKGRCEAKTDAAASADTHPERPLTMPALPKVNLRMRGE